MEAHVVKRWKTTMLVWKKETMRQAVYLLMVATLMLAGCAAEPHNNAGAKPALTILTEEYAPLNFTQEGRLTGQASEVVQELIKRTGTEAAIRVVPWEEGYRAVLKQPDTHGDDPRAQMASAVGGSRDGA